MKRNLLIIVSLVLIFNTFAFGASAEKDITVTLDGELLTFDVAPAIINNRTMVPLRKIFESLGADVKYDENTKQITAVKGDITVNLCVNSLNMYVNDKLYELDIPATVVNNRTLVPIRAVSEAFDCDVEWIEEEKNVKITSKYAEGENNEEVAAPVIDFSNDTDGVMKALHYDTRYIFEQQALPELIFADDGTLAKLIVENPGDFIAEIDNGPWFEAMCTVIIRYLADDTQEYVIKTEEDVYNLIAAKADEFSLHAYQSYEPECVMLDDKYCVLLNMADINEMPISAYVAIVYDEKEGFSYFMLEESFGDSYMLCGREGEKHVNYGTVENNKEAFLNAVENILNKA